MSQVKTYTTAEIRYGTQGDSFVAAADHDAEVAELRRQIQIRDEVGCIYCGGEGHVHRLDGEYLGVCDSCPAYELSCAKHTIAQLQDCLGALEAIIGACDLCIVSDDVSLIDTFTDQLETAAREAIAKAKRLSTAVMNVSASHDE